MTELNRRRFLEGSAGIAATAAIGTGAVWAPSVQAQTLAYKAEKDAKLRVLRWSRFVQGDIDAYMVNVKKFSDKTGIEVRVDNEGWEDVRPKAAVAANTGAGPDIILSTNDDANLYPEKLLDVTDLCEYLGKKYGGWYPSCEAFLRPDGKKWLGVPLGSAGAMQVYRESMLKAAGLPELVTTSLDDYEALALKLATDTALLPSFRRKLADHRSTCPLFDGDRFRRHVEAAYTTMWDRHRRGESPRHFRVDPNA